MITPHQWIELRRNLPKELQMLCVLCYDYAENMDYFQSIGNALNGYDVAKMQSLTHQIMSEYIKIVRQQLKLEKEEVKELEQDIAKNLSVFFDEKGRVKNLGPEFSLMKTHGRIDIHFPLLLAPITGFIDSRIFHSLKEAEEFSKSFLIQKFTQSTLKKAGILPKYLEQGFIQSFNQPRVEERGELSWD